ncbi:3'-5' exonuclease [Puniceibacterium sediminis]|uniref:DNA polymerase-3 subunit epsilon n=1 Tax=Puniceibacterium sediminis TaxID=1608407 RepID=A0A238XM77_9RHOB|nr:hypothetical protein [Puniceibacterium sediminis]SNR60027.1 DNA polymerase-3 subunit epsilon [Puniceibacterium sediminis]
MIERNGFRFRVFRVFAVLALTLVGGLQAALWIGSRRTLDIGSEAGFALVGVAGTGLILVLCVAAWLYFDERIAKPLERRAFAPVTTDVRPTLSQEDIALQDARRMARAMALLESDKAQLIRLISEIPGAILVINTADQIVLYDSQAADLLARLGVPRLNAPLGDYLEATGLSAARSKMQRTGLEVRFTASAIHSPDSLSVRLRPLDNGNALVIFQETEASGGATLPGPLVYDFALMAPRNGQDIDSMSLNALTYLVLSTETTGLLPHRDNIVKIGAVRMVGSRILRRETLELRIDPASKNAGETSEDGRMGILEASAELHKFAHDAVIVAHNAPLRMAFLRHHAGVTWDHPQIDLVLLSALLFGDGADHSLRSLASRTGVGPSHALSRGGLAQAILAAEVLQRLMPMLAARELDSLRELMDALDQHADSLEKLH